jgi:CHAT domain-containing protein
VACLLRHSGDPIWVRIPGSGTDGTWTTEGYLGFAQPLFAKGARSLVVSLWKVNDKATSLLMERFYQNLLGKRSGLDKPMPKAEALAEAKEWLRKLTAKEVDAELARSTGGETSVRCSAPLILPQA